MKAGMVPFNSPNTRRALHTQRENDCFAQCMYALKFVDYKSALLLQDISIHSGINVEKVIDLFEMAYPTKFNWLTIYPTSAGIFNYDDFLISPNEATLCSINRMENGEIIKGHFVILYKEGSNIMVRDPQNNSIYLLNDYTKIDVKMYNLDILGIGEDEMYDLPNIDYKMEDYEYNITAEMIRQTVLL